MKELAKGSRSRAKIPTSDALSLRSRRSGTKFAAPLLRNCLLSTNVFQGASFGIGVCRRCFFGFSGNQIVEFTFVINGFVYGGFYNEVCDLGVFADIEDVWLFVLLSNTEEKTLRNILFQEQFFYGK